ncbi:hypothetical protein SAMN02799630_02801 [Paenibacillus sp. UNCCL117]|uniref:phage tail assembly chaperone G n=1 Tax=unclassified Paenibacillus TaxID=185978 RepID=UPI0008853870|nr:MULTISPECIES: hypothetical protein [unclassified Paenibacillus]SDD26925.1 hypothetical protein SAMN04488602_107111 [Paenibacillus sp. cl123]SFW40638.1 hypothetical protein SAMN02799630_02801 [Paenibacillus sp. UNCCL117]
MEIKLKVEGKDTTFTQGFISGLMFRRTLEIQKKFDGKIDETTLDAMVDYVVDLFDKQFNRDTFYRGVDARVLLPTITNCINEVVNGASDAVGTDPDAPNV